MAIEAAKFNDLPVERESMIGEFGFPESDAACVAVYFFTVQQQTNVDRVQGGLLQIPQRDWADGLPAALSGPEQMPSFARYWMN